MAGPVFVSYSHAADADYVDRLVAFLESQGINTWYDRAIVPGTRWAEIISDQIAECSVFVVVMSPEAERSTWMIREIDHALLQAKPIMPLLLGGDVFLQLSHIQYEDVRGGKLPSKRFLAMLQRLLQAPPPSPPPDVVVPETVEDPGPTKVFINYRREDSEFAAHWLYGTLTGTARIEKPLAAESIFIDLSTLVGGAEFSDEITRAILQCKIMLVLIGTRWLTATDDVGIQRLHLPNDLLRQEVELAFKHRLTVIPVLLGKATMPDEKHLPKTLIPLRQRHALRLEPDDFVHDVDRLATHVDRILAKQTPPTPERFRAPSGPTA